MRDGVVKSDIEGIRPPTAEVLVEDKAVPGGGGGRMPSRWRMRESIPMLRTM